MKFLERKVWFLREVYIYVENRLNSTLAVLALFACILRNESTIESFWYVNTERSPIQNRLLICFDLCRTWMLVTWEEASIGVLLETLNKSRTRMPRSEMNACSTELLTLSFQLECASANTDMGWMCPY